ncbi:unnamed protein product [Owenia fusiformis]|uniref:Uncharacterized protein n=1 Tax=Owenia fusiformis TaxID=6347 RepID=A0A8J1XIY7_OWEFU|nr:unnamed protein product [Owenia fusiformis]
MTQQEYKDAIATCKTTIRLKRGKPPFGRKKTKSSGKLEIKIQYKWRSVCYSTMLDQRAAKYFCDLLGIKSENPFVFGDQYFGPAKKNKTWWVSWSCADGYCIIDNNKNTNESCAINQYASLKCYNKEPKDAVPELRLSGGTNYSGTLEMKRFGVWGGVSVRSKYDSRPEINRVAKVACQQLGFEAKEYAFEINRDRKRHTTLIWFLDVFCSGNENNMLACDHKKWGETLHRGVGTYPVYVTCMTPLKLKHKTNSYTGELYIFLDGWRRVCLEGWTTPTLMVACRYLGLEWRYADVILTYSTVDGHDEWYKDGTLCQGHEETLSQCAPASTMHHPFLTICRSRTGTLRLLTCPDTQKTVLSKLSVRLYRTDHGEMAVQVEDKWLPMCNSNWNDGGAMVACRQLGFNPENGQNFGKTLNHRPDRVIVTDMNCTGQETNLNECTFMEWKIVSIGSVENTCRSVQDGVNIGCTDKSTKARLVGGPDNYSGRVEIWHKNEWKKVCGRFIGVGFYTMEAQAICDDIERPGQYARHYKSNYFGMATRATAVRISCNRGEKLDVCRIYETNCTDKYNYDLGVTCFDHNPGLHEYLQPGALGYDLDDISRRNDGIVVVNSEYNHDKKEHTICGGDTWTRSEAQVVCRQLGYDPVDATVDEFPFLQCFGGDTIIMSDVNCTGDERSLAEYGLRASVFCGKLPIVLEENGRESKFKGEVMVRDLRNGWPLHPVCGSGWDEKDAKVVCRQLGYPYENASVYFMEYTPNEYDPDRDGPLITNVNCKGDETHLGKCDFDLDFSLVAAQGQYDGYSYCTKYELLVDYIDFDMDFNLCNNGSIAGVICK